MLIHVRVGWVGKANSKIIYLPTPPLEAYARHQPQGRSLQFEEICIVIERKDVWLENVFMIFICWNASYDCWRHFQGCPWNTDLRTCSSKKMNTYVAWKTELHLI